MKLLLASRNAHKAQELAELLPGFAFVLWPPHAPEIPETGAFFQDNALQKATFARDWWAAHGDRAVDGVLADDSGLCVDALWGGPGVLSARFAKELPRDAKNRKLLSMIPEGADRTARFVCVLALVRHADDPLPLLCQAEWQGEILEALRGDQGFGYDPLFWVPAEGMSSAELPRERKNALSHRGQALQLLKARIGAFL